MKRADRRAKDEAVRDNMVNIESDESDESDR